MEYTNPAAQACDEFAVVIMDAAPVELYDALRMPGFLTKELSLGLNDAMIEAARNYLREQAIPEGLHLSLIAAVSAPMSAGLFKALANSIQESR